jgi:hypothetical protein
MVRRRWMLRVVALPSSTVMLAFPAMLSFQQAEASRLARLRHQHWYSKDALRKQLALVMGAQRL